MTDWFEAVTRALHPLEAPPALKKGKKLLNEDQI